MLIESKGYQFLSLVHAINTDGVKISPCIMKQGRDKGCFQYTFTGTKNFKGASLIQLLDMLIDGQFDERGTIRMRLIEEPTQYSNNALSPTFNKSELIAFRKTL